VLSCAVSDPDSDEENLQAAKARIMKRTPRATLLLVFIVFRLKFPFMLKKYKGHPEKNILFPG
jgi:hypothetical protein